MISVVYTDRGLKFKKRFSNHVNNVDEEGKVVKAEEEE